MEENDMKDRLVAIMREQQMNQRQFADALGIAPASLSNIFSGRSAPTIRHAEAVHQAFPAISLTWFLFGEGPMKRAEGEDAAGADTLLATTKTGEEAPKSLFDFPAQATQPPKEVVKYVERPARKIVEVRIFFSDGTYETLEP